MKTPTQQYYAENAERLATQYRAADISFLHALLRRWLPVGGSVLEIGCGSGRDAVFMASLGMSVVATDACEPMITLAKRGSEQHGIDFLNAAFPLQSGHALLNDRFDAIVAVAMLMHVPDQDLFDFAYQVRTLIKTGGRFNGQPQVVECAAINLSLLVNRPGTELRRHSAWMPGRRQKSLSNETRLSVWLRRSARIRRSAKPAPVP